MSGAYFERLFAGGGEHFIISAKEFSQEQECMEKKDKLVYMMKKIKILNFLDSISTSRAWQSSDSSPPHAYKNKLQNKKEYILLKAIYGWHATIYVRNLSHIHV